MSFTTEQIVDAVNAAGFETLAEFGAFLAIGRKQIEIAQLIADELKSFGG